MTPNKTFTKDDLQMGYIVRLRNGEFRAVHPAGKTGTFILIGHDKWDYLNCWDHHLYSIRQRFAKGCPVSAETASRAKGMDIVAVYGYVYGTENYLGAGYIDSDHRPLLWAREEPKKMTLAEVCEKLGYPIELVPEE